MKIISFTKFKTNIYHCASKLKNKFTKQPKINLTEVEDRFDKRSYARMIMQYPNDGYNLYICRRALKDLPELTRSNYNRLSQEELNAIRGHISLDTAENAQIIVNNSKVIKQFLDKKYGQNGYVFAAADQTYSPIAKCLEYMGDESATKPTNDLTHHFKKVVFCSGSESQNEIKSLKKRFKSKNHVFIQLTKELKNNRDIKDFENLRQRLRFETYSDKKPLSEAQKKFQFCLLDILNS